MAGVTAALLRLLAAPLRALCPLPDRGGLRLFQPSKLIYASSCFMLLCSLNNWATHLGALINVLLQLTTVWSFVSMCSIGVSFDTIRTKDSQLCDWMGHQANLVWGGRDKSKTFPQKSPTRTPTHQVHKFKPPDLQYSSTAERHTKCKFY